MENRLAKLLVEHSLHINPSDVLVVDFQDHTMPLYKQIKKEIEKIGAETIEFVRPRFITLADLYVLDEKLDGATSYLRLSGGIYKQNTKEGCNYERKEGEIMNKRCKLKWTVTPYPSQEMANLLSLPLEELRELYFNSCFVDYNKQRKLQESIAKMFKEGKVSIQGKDVDLRFDIVRNPHYCSGEINMPDGEVFWEIDPASTEGQIQFSIPLFYGSMHFNRIYLDFRKGKVINFDSDNKNHLEMLLKLDEQAPYLGEFGIGTNPAAKVIGNSFIDEKVDGTFHVALGAMNPEAESRLHLDLVKYLEGCKIINNERPVNLI